MVYPKNVYYKNSVFVVDEQVYEPAEDTFLIAEKMKVTGDDIILDIGTGCGILAVLAAKKAKKIIAVDINPHSIACAIRNAEAHGVSNKIFFLNGALFQPINKSERFSLIIFNAPYLPSEPGDENCWIGKAWSGGPNGRQVIDPFITASSHWLTEDGRILLVQSSLSGINRTLEMFNKKNLDARVIGQVKFPFERIVLIEATRFK